MNQTQNDNQQYKDQLIQEYYKLVEERNKLEGQIRTLERALFKVMADNAGNLFTD